MISAISILQFFTSQSANAQLLPNDSLFQTGRVVITFSPGVIDPSYFCELPVKTPTSPKENKRNIILDEENYITPNNNLITRPNVVSYLNSQHAQLEPLWEPCFDPCGHRYEITQWGDTLFFSYWSTYVAHIPDTASVVNFTYGLALTDFTAFEMAEPITIFNKDTIRDIPNDPLYSNQLYLYETNQYTPFNNIGINIQEAWDYTKGNWDVGMAVFDQGYNIDIDVPLDFKHYNQENQNYETNIVEKTNYSGNPYWDGFSTHSLYISGIMGALRNNKNQLDEYVGIAGIAGGDWENGNKGCRLYLEWIFSGDKLDEIRAFDRLLSTAGCDNNVRVFNLSYGNGTSVSGIFKSGYQWERYLGYARAYRRGAILSNAKMQAGDRGNTDAYYPSWLYDLPNGLNDQWFIGVGASDQISSPALAYWCQWGGNLRLLAPSVYDIVYSTIYDGYGYNAGNPSWDPAVPSNLKPGATSWASPQVAGTAALILSRDNTLLNDDVAGLMEATASKIRYREVQIWNSSLLSQNTPYDQHTGFGLLNAGYAVSLVSDVQRGYIDLGGLTDEVYNNWVNNEYIDIEEIPEHSGDIFLVNQTETDDPYRRDGFFLDSNYLWQRYKVKVRVNVPFNSGQHLLHAWGIGMGHNFVPDTKGWEYGVCFYNDSSPQYYWWCSETPYSKVDPSSIMNSICRFQIYTYIYKVTATNISNNGQKITYYPTDPRHCSLSYGYILYTPSPPTNVIDASPQDKLSIINIYPNPSSDKTTIRFSIKNDDIYTISIKDIMGNDILIPLKDESIGIGINEFSFEVSNLSSGVYICSISSIYNGEFISKPFSIIK